MLQILLRSQVHPLYTVCLGSVLHTSRLLHSRAADPPPPPSPCRGSVSRIGGMSLQDLQRESETLWAKGFPEKAMTKLEDFGFIQSKAKVGRSGGGEEGSRAGAA